MKLVGHFGFNISYKDKSGEWLPLMYVCDELFLFYLVHGRESVWLKDMSLWYINPFM